MGFINTTTGYTNLTDTQLDRVEVRKRFDRLLYESFKLDSRNIEPDAGIPENRILFDPRSGHSHSGSDSGELGTSSGDGMIKGIHIDPGSVNMLWSGHPTGSGFWGMWGVTVDNDGNDLVITLDANGDGETGEVDLRNCYWDISATSPPSGESYRGRYKAWDLGLIHTAKVWPTILAVSVNGGTFPDDYTHDDADNNNALHVNVDTVAGYQFTISASSWTFGTAGSMNAGTTITVGALVFVHVFYFGAGVVGGTC